jgi:(E)-4-hydroxy-3-methylbut-2-enyl-diphosphate synthase
MIEANRIACTEMDKNEWRFPIHLGVTESGDGEYARIKSAIGLGTLLTDGIGDTIRVSLTEDPINEIFTAKHILQACCVRRFYPEIISCPSCGRTSYDIQSILGQVKEITKNVSQQKSLKIAVMGCIINGLGEANDADIAIVGNYNGTLSIFKRKICVSKDVMPEDFQNAFSQVLIDF